MRIRKQNIQIRSGSALICDRCVIGDHASEELDDCARFRSWHGDGDFSVYSDGDCFFIDLDPRILKAKTRPDLTPLPGQVSVDTAEIGIYDLTEGRYGMANRAIARGSAVVIQNLIPGTYLAWFEEKETARDAFRGVIGFGPKVKMLLNSSAAEQVQELEDRIARAYRLKGDQKHAELAAVRDNLMELHLSGCNDPRLRMLASAVKLDLPRRSSKRRQ